MEITKQDIRSNTLLKSIKLLKEEFQSDFVENILEISSNPISNENFNQLKRIERATDQYRKRTNNLFYIGFLGHFSSGKSSTINTLLHLNGTMYEKKADHNPTDDQITLITCEKNNQDVIKLTRSGQVPVIISLIEGNSILADKVIMDTPGSGDPSTFEEIVRDSLPLCDLIIYTLSATNPLTNSDIPLLKEKEKHLSSIPTIYLITRGNEFKLNNLEILNDANFNNVKYQKFASELAGRIKQVVDSIDLEYDDFIVIDNIERFNIEILEEKINFYCNADKYGNILQLHDHKIEYFTRTLKDIKAYFIQLIVTKLDIIEKYFTQAQVKLDEYEQTTLIGTDKMVNSWRSTDDKIKLVIDGSISQNNTIFKLINTPDEFLNLITIKEWLKKQYEIYSITDKNKIENHQTQIKSRLIDLKEKVQFKLFGLIDRGTILSAEAIQDDIDSQIEKLLFANNTNYDIIELHNKIHKDTFDYLDNSCYSELKRQIDSLKNRTKNRNPLESISKYINEAKQILNEIFETYKNGVKIYTVAAFSFEAKSYIKNLGLSDKLDLIDITEPDINYYLAQTEKEIFREFNDAVNKLENACSQIFININNIEYNSPIITTESNIVQLKDDEATIINSYALKFDSLSQNFNTKVNNYFSIKIQSIHSELTTLDIKKYEAINNLKRKRINYYLKYFIPFFLIFLISIALFIFIPKINFPKNLSIGYQWLLGILINATSAIIISITSIKKDKHEIYKNEIENNCIENEKQIISKVLNQDFEDFKIDLASDQSQAITELLRNQSNDILRMVLSNKYNLNNKSLHSNLIKNENILKQLLTDYSDALNEFKAICSKILNNTTFNKEVLLKQSKLIQENSISPSFRLLEQTRNNIAEVKTKIEHIDFI